MSVSDVTKPQILILPSRIVLRVDDGQTGSNPTCLTSRDYCSRGSLRRVACRPVAEPLVVILNKAPNARVSTYEYPTVRQCDANALRNA